MTTIKLDAPLTAGTYTLTPVGTTPPVEPPIDPPPVEPPPTTTPPPSGQAVIVTATAKVMSPGQPAMRFYSGKDNGPPMGNIPQFGARDILVIPFLTPSTATPKFTLGATHTATGSKTREFMVADRPDAYTPTSPGVLWTDTAISFSQRMTAGAPEAGRINLDCARTYYLIINNLLPGQPPVGGPYDVVVTLSNP